MFRDCRRTLQDLTSFVDRYQDVASTDLDAPDGEPEVGRAWKDLLVDNWETVWWTSDGGNADKLRETLRMHVVSVASIMQALRR